MDSQAIFDTYNMGKDPVRRKTIMRRMRNNYNYIFDIVNLN
jgi:hypothetical protein